ncbi:sulfotransferase [Glutamicibacter creatinolyticus]|uniref:sulfotransferase n=1 Tax=Glutamicibacter creatinolyticus TaxID=162496 RepID=UPI003B981362
MDSLGDIREVKTAQDASGEAPATAAGPDPDPQPARRESADGPPRRPRVVMLGGFGRSGSTLLERCLAQCEDFMGLGELLHLWERGLRDNELCGCGLPFHECPVWQQIGVQAYGRWARIDTEQAIADRRTVIRNRFLPELILQRGFGQRRQARQRLLSNLSKLYRAADTVADGKVLVDSSKHPAYAYFLRSLPIDLRCVLVVRDPRGVAYSWSKVVTRPETGSRAEDMPRYSVPASIFNWTTYSLLFHALTLLRVPVLTVHYEEFMTDPTRTLEEVIRFAGLEPTQARVPEFADGHITLDAHHTVAGNPMRFKVGQIKLKFDNAWTTKMKDLDRRLATTLSAPLRLFYRFNQR